MDEGMWLLSHKEMNMLKFKAQEVRDLCSKLTPKDELTLVGDSGVYIMSFASPVEGRTIVYAEGCNPKDEGWYDVKDDEYGGDDGGDEIGSVAQMLQILGTKSWLFVKLTSNSIKISAI
jgi:hypothetical protein